MLWLIFYVIKKKKSHQVNQLNLSTNLEKDKLEKYCALIFIFKFSQSMINI